MNTEAIDGVQEEFDSRVNLVPVPDIPISKAIGIEGRFPEEVKQEQVQSNEHANQRRFQDQQDDEEFLHPLIDGFPGDQHTQRSQKWSASPATWRFRSNPCGSECWAWDPGMVDLILEPPWARWRCTGKCKDRHKSQQRYDEENMRTSR